MAQLAPLEELDDITVLGLARTVKRRMAGMVAQQRVGSPLKQHGHCAGAAERRRNHQRRGARFTVGNINCGAVVEQ